MQIKKGDKFRITDSNEIYQIAGRWCGEYVLSPQKPNDEVCLIYTLKEMEEFVIKGTFAREK